MSRSLSIFERPFLGIRPLCRFSEAIATNLLYYEKNRGITVFGGLIRNGKGRTRMAELIVDARPDRSRSQRIPAEGDHGGIRLRVLGLRHGVGGRKLSRATRRCKLVAFAVTSRRALTATTEGRKLTQMNANDGNINSRFGGAVICVHLR